MRQNALHTVFPTIGSVVQEDFNKPTKQFTPEVLYNCAKINVLKYNFYFNLK